MMSHKLFYVYRWTDDMAQAFEAGLGPNAESVLHAPRGEVISKNLDRTSAEAACKLAREQASAADWRKGYRYEFSDQVRVLFT